jgi:hypothetical protein
LWAWSLRSGGAFGGRVWTATGKLLAIGCLGACASLASGGGAAAAGPGASGAPRAVAVEEALRLFGGGLGVVTCSTLRDYGLLDQTPWRIGTAL